MKRMKRATKTYRDVLTGEVKRKQRFIQKCPRFMPVQTLTGWIVAEMWVSSQKIRRIIHTCETQAEANAKAASLITVEAIKCK